MDSNSYFLKQLNNINQLQFTGLLKIKSTKNIFWKLYFGFGKLIWAEGGVHPQRCWRRHLDKYFAQIDLTELNAKDITTIDCQNYQILAGLLQKNLIQQEQVQLFLESFISEILFDILQEEFQRDIDCNLENKTVSFLSSCGFKMSLACVNLEEARSALENEWEDWLQKGLKNCSPNFAPRLKNQEQLKEEVSEIVYQHFVKFIDGQRTFRDLAFAMNKELVKLTCSLIPYIRKGTIDLIEVADVSPEANLYRTQTKNLSKAIYKPTIACIDDSPQILKIMEQILKQAGYQFVGIKEALQAIPTLISRNPDLIFLDIGMPVINGYEICSQLRRVSSLKETPVIILTGNDGIVDRVRAKVVGASDFIPKPVDVQKILSKVEKHLSSGVPQ